MSPTLPASSAAINPAAMFAALGDVTRLSLIANLSQGEPKSISQLTGAQVQGAAPLSRQAITKHLRVLEDAGLVHNVRAGRESRFVLDPKPVREMRAYLDRVAAHWDQALDRLKALVEEG